MCSNFCQGMDDNYQGDLSDIIRASACVIGGNGSATSTTSGGGGSGGGGDGGFGSSITTTNNSNISLSNNYSEYQNNNQLKGFYHPFAGDISAILGNHLDTDVIPTSTNLQGLSGGGGGGGGNVDVGRLTQVVGSPSIMANNICKTANNIASSNIASSSMVLQDNNNNNNNNNNNCSISYSNKRNMKLPLLGAAEASSKVVKSGFGFMSNSDMFNNNNNQSSGSTKSGFVDGPTTGVQILSPSNHQVGIKRRKIQAKKVVCIPAIAAANSRQTGEVVPSDLWAWRKYGQKPIKGSPYPRGYYRCSSSKGCSARKQVERSRTDPNMLVITYTSEHNHPWPTQRNALAGSTRSSSQPLKTSSKHCSSSPPKSSSSNHKNPLVKEENSNQSASTSTIKDEELRFNNGGDNKVHQGLHQSCENDVNNDELFNDSYRPLIVAEPNINGHQEVVDQDFFSDLVEFDSDDDLLKLFTAHQEVKELDDPFSGAFDWPTNNTTTNEENNDHIHSTTLSPTSKIS